MNGLVLIDKPAGCTSHDVVNQLRRIAGTKRVGHLGTLDPMATGLLALLMGSATRLAQFHNAREKTYEAEIQFGCVSDTYDADGEVTATSREVPGPEQIRSAIEEFRGKMLQTPPPVSAKKIKGVPAYKLARKNVEVALEPVEVDIKSLMVDRISGATLNVTITCSAGTYIRSIAHEVGQRLGCGAILSRLRRTRSGDFDISEARTIDELKRLQQEGRFETAVKPTSDLLPEFPAEYVDLQTETQIRQGRDFRTSPFVVRPGARYVKAMSKTGQLIAVGELKFPNLYHPSIVL